MLWDKYRMTRTCCRKQRSELIVSAAKMNAKGTTQSHKQYNRKILEELSVTLCCNRDQRAWKNPHLSSAKPRQSESKRNVRLGKKTHNIYRNIWCVSFLFWFWSSLSFLPTAPRDWDYRFLFKTVLQEWSQVSDHAPPKLNGKVGASDPIFSKCILCCNLPATQFWDKPDRQPYPQRASRVPTCKWNIFQDWGF